MKPRAIACAVALFLLSAATSAQAEPTFSAELLRQMACASLHGNSKLRTQAEDRALKAAGVTRRDYLEYVVQNPAYASPRIRSCGGGGRLRGEVVVNAGEPIRVVVQQRGDKAQARLYSPSQTLVISGPLRLSGTVIVGSNRDYQARLEGPSDPKSDRWTLILRRAASKKVYRFVVRIPPVGGA